MIAYLATIPPIVYGLTLALPYLYVAAGRWRASMLLDASLLALYFVRPSLALWVFCGGLIVVRWVPTLAGELAAMLRLGDYEGWTARVIRFTLPALTTTPATGKTTVLDMSSAPRLTVGSAGTQVVHVPVAPTGSSLPEQNAVLADTDAENAGFELPRVSRHNSERELIIYLAAQRKSDGKYRFSANDIDSFMKGMARADVLAIVRGLREAPAFPPTTPEQQQAREELGL